MSPADESGAFVGYTYEYFERLAQYTGWSYEFVPVEGSGPAAYKTLRDLLGAGDADCRGRLAGPLWETSQIWLNTLKSQITDSIVMTMHG